MGRLAVYLRRMATTKPMGTSATSCKKADDEVRAHVLSSDVSRPAEMSPSRSVG